MDASMNALSDPVDRLDAARLRVARARARLSAHPLQRVARSKVGLARVKQDIDVASALVHLLTESDFTDWFTHPLAGSLSLSLSLSPPLSLRTYSLVDLLTFFFLLF